MQKKQTKLLVLAFNLIRSVCKSLMVLVRHSHLAAAGSLSNPCDFKKQKTLGFTLVELMVVVAIIALLALVAAPKYWRFHAKAKRAEVYLNLSALHTAEKLYWAEHGKYSDVIIGEGGIDWRPDGQTNYTYGFAGAAGTNHILGKLGVDTSALGDLSNANEQGFTAVAIADIDGDGKPDVITINEHREIKIVQDDLSD